MADVVVEVTVMFGGDGGETRALKTLLERGSGRDKILDRLGHYISQLKTTYSSEGVSTPAKKVKPSPVPVTKNVVNTVENRNVTAPVGKRKLKKKPGQRSNDFLFYLSLVSIVGLTATLVTRI